MRNVFDAILECGHDEDFEPVVSPDFQPTDAPAGSQAKLEVLAERIRRGFPLWHQQRLQQPVCVSHHEKQRLILSLHLQSIDLKSTIGEILFPLSFFYLLHSANSIQI